MSEYAILINTLNNVLIKKQAENILEAAEASGINKQQFSELLSSTTGWEADEAIKNLTRLAAGQVGILYSIDAILNGIKNVSIYEKLSRNLSKLNVNRGSDAHKLKGFVFEELHAADATINGIPTEVINNNSNADFIITNTDGTITYGQAKTGYKTTSIDYSKYDGQTLVLDKNNPKITKAKKAGVKVTESNITDKKAYTTAKKMQTEAKITKSKNSVIVPKANSAINIAKEANKVGIKTASRGAQFGGGFSIGTNLVDVVNGDKALEEAAVDVAKDTVISAGAGYVTRSSLTVPVT